VLSNVHGNITLILATQVGMINNAVLRSHVRSEQKSPYFSYWVARVNSTNFTGSECIPINWQKSSAYILIQFFKICINKMSSTNIEMNPSQP
jgi:hypothetical protein